MGGRLHDHDKALWHRRARRQLQCETSLCDVLGRRQDRCSQDRRSCRVTPQRSDEILDRRAAIAEDLTAMPPYREGDPAVTALADLGGARARPLEDRGREVNPQTVQLAPLINDVISTAGQLAEQNKNRLVVNAPEDLSGLTVDPMRLRQILLNLLSNACKFTKAGEVKLAARKVSDRGAADGAKAGAGTHRRHGKPAAQMTNAGVGRTEQLLRHAPPPPLWPRLPIRQAFLQDVARALGELPEVGDGVVTRVCAQVQRKYWHPPEIGWGGAGSGKYR